MLLLLLSDPINGAEGCGGDVRGDDVCEGRSRRRRRLCGRERLSLRALHLLGELPLRLRAVALAAAVVLEGVCHGDGPVAEELPVHRLDRRVGRLEGVKLHEAVALCLAALGVPGDLGVGDDLPERGERVQEHPLVDGRVEVPDEQARAHVEDGARAEVAPELGLDGADGPPEEGHAVHDARGVVGVLGRGELGEAKAGVAVGRAVSGDVHADDGARLEHQLPQEVLCDLGGELADKHGGLLVALFGDVTVPASVSVGAGGGGG